MFKVLVAEDEPKSRGALISRLRGILGDAALIEAASDGNDAVDKALRVQPDVIFMDIEMPGKNGLKPARSLKSKSRRSTSFSLPPMIDLIMQWGRSVPVARTIF